MKKITSQNDLDEMLSIPYWEDSIIKEMIVVSPSYITETRGTVAPNSAPALKILIFTPEYSCPCLELLFVELVDMYCFFRGDLNPIGKFEKNGIFLYLNGEAFIPIQAEELYYTIHTPDYWGWKNHYSNQTIFDKAGFLIENL